MLIVTAIIIIEMKPESVAEIDFLPAVSRNNRNKFDLEIFK